MPMGQSWREGERGDGEKEEQEEQEETALFWIMVANDVALESVLSADTRLGRCLD